MADGVNVRGCVGEEARLGQNMWGGRLPVIWGVKLIDEKNREIISNPNMVKNRNLIVCVFV
jgi:hypothetical protein